MITSTITFLVVKAIIVHSVNYYYYYYYYYY